MNPKLAHFFKLLRQIHKLRYVEASKVIKLIEGERSKTEFEEMSDEVFLAVANNMIKNKLQNESVFCSYCLKYFHNMKDRNNHIRMIHKNISEGKFVCELCEKSYMSKTALKYHTDIVHAMTIQTEKCPICKLAFGHKISLNRHMKVHQETLDLHKCNLCDKEFCRKDKLTKHTKTVHGKVNVAIGMVKMFENLSDKSYTCKICGKLFNGDTAKEELQEHLVENKCKQFECSECAKKFSRKDNFEQHKRILHSGSQKTISCKLCDFVTKHKNSLTRHMKLVHNDK